MFSEHQHYGLTGEKWVLERLTTLGFSAMWLSDFFEDIDLIVSGLLKVEVKTSRPKPHRARRGGHWRQRWQFDLTRLPQDQDFVVVCLCDVPGEGLYPFVIPGGLLNPMGRYHLQITSHPAKYSGWAAAYRDRWDVVGMLLERRQRAAGQLMLPLFAHLGHS